MTVDQAAVFFGGKKRLAAALGLTPAAISMWGDSVPFLRQCQIQVISGGQLRADVDGRDTKSSADLEEIVPPISQPGQTNKPAGDPYSGGESA
ncbi:Cro/CI family transcriptional regulator [Pseudomonas nitroreducens]|uniref:Cro/CI family transcriptional regulator n=1 Tax=Pseudomonas nitroreducens TaxID=46680 RepID=UPI002D7F96FA|nr:Cro/CI family transcriptional regulator [Pseudomonas nitroreducens]